MRYWILAGDGSRDANDLPRMVVPEVFGLWLGGVTAGLHEEDRVFVWQTLPDVGVVGLGEVDSLLPSSDGLSRDCWVRYLNYAFKPPVARKSIRTELQNIPLPSADAEFELMELSSEEATALYRVVVSANQAAADTWPDLLHAPLPPDPDDLALAAREGRAQWRAHLRRERNCSIIEAKRRSVLKQAGRLACEVCGFDFRSVYGELGRGYCEVHHREPLHLATAERQTALADLAIVCSNCHKMLHRSNPVLSVAELGELIKDR